MMKLPNTTSVLPMTWVHSCISIDSTLNHMVVVINGEKLEDKAFPIPAGWVEPLQPKPLFKDGYFLAGIHIFDQKRKITNLYLPPFGRRLLYIQRRQRRYH